MIMEHFDESLILMKETLCWSYEDIAYKIANSHGKSKEKLSLEARASLKTFLSNEYEMYNFFLTKLRKKINSYGRAKMQANIIELHKARASLFERCYSECGHLPACSFLPHSHLTLSDTCPCEAPFDLCKNCLALNVAGGGILLNHYAHCIQSFRQ